MEIYPSQDKLARNRQQINPHAGVSRVPKVWHHDLKILMQRSRYVNGRLHLKRQIKWLLFAV
ncbi:hypothetical protein BT96DRAFT_929698 [Gymnopus androsaceus JB14]|uniref:Uncharacterized protein n=1 Tax=Gymnopus androsaceus JB14 TaxID=1447944 RepID=A0A6A4GDV1_9AGAR|nr:hypothetical protein BT96DRAFT_929698 [Gymnopus androsaceus JB14]